MKNVRYIILGIVIGILIAAFVMLGYSCSKQQKLLTEYQEELESLKASNSEESNQPTDQLVSPSAAAEVSEKQSDQIEVPRIALPHLYDSANAASAIQRAYSQAKSEISNGEYSGDVDTRTREIMNSNKTYLLSTANAIYNNGVEKWGCRIECADSCQQSSLLNESWEAWHYISADGYYFFEISPNGSWFPISEPTTLYLKTVVILSDEKDPHGYATESVYEVNADPYSVKSGTSWSTIQSTNIVEPTGRYAGTTFTWNTDWTITFLYN